jgi:ribonuclease T1
VRWLAAAALAFCTGALALSNEVDVKELPREARETLALIKSGGPFRYSQDGRTFQNREKLLPRQQRGYYREYTVKTPGARDRGARRIVAGRNGEYYYTDDHYRSFRRIIE